MAAVSKFEEVVKNYRNGFSPVVSFDPGTDRLLLLDFTERNKDLTGDVIGDTARFTAYVQGKLEAAGARYGIGGYLEHRTIYSRSPVFDGVEGEEPRRLHLGVDIWGKPGTAVRAPLDGIVHSFAFNRASGDYGATIILSHQLDGLTFYTLYGHLSLASIQNLTEGMRIEKSDVLAEFGIPQENGNWPPHLHFQVVLDLEGRKGDYPGVAPFSEKEKWAANCPDGDTILDMMKYAVPR